MEIEENFWSRADWDIRNPGCWEWNSTKNSDEYGTFYLKGSTVQAHRLAYELEVGDIPAGLQIDHTCRNRACVNPNHLEPVTLQENVRRGEVGRHFGSKTHCPQGHPYDNENTYRPASGGRHCRACNRKRCLDRYHRLKGGSDG